MNLKDLLGKAKYQILPDKEKTRQAILQSVAEEQAETKHAAPAEKRPNKPVMRWIPALAACLLLMIGLGWSAFRYFQPDPSENITGDIRSLSEIVYVAPRNNANSSLDIVTKHKISTEELMSHIVIEPRKEYSVQKKGVNRFTLTFDEPLDNDTAYTISSVSSDKVLYQWSLQAERKFGIQNVYPTTDTDGYADVDTTVEITFTESSVNNLEPFFSIEPKVDGEFRHNGRTWIFIPREELSPYTTYTVRISGEIVGKEEDQPLGEDRVFRFTTGFSDKKYAYVLKNGSDLTDTFLSEEEPVVKVIANGMTGNTADITVYRIPDAATFKKIHIKYEDTDILPAAVAADISAENMKKYFDFSAAAVKASNEDDEYYFLYPQKLEAGYYLTEIRWSDVVLYQLVQITDLSVYAVNGNEDISLWVNDTRTKLPAENLTVRIDGNEKKTDENGIAVFKNISGDANHVLTVTSKNLPDYIAFLPKFDRAAKSKYFTYLYTNSSIYRPTDTIRAWGCVLKRDPAAADPVVRLHSDWDDADHAVTLDENGTFSLEIPLEQYKLSREIELDMLVDDQQVSSKVLTVSDYDLPVYRLTSSSDKNAYFAGETAATEVSVKYYDGTPAPALAVKSDAQTLTTDQNGTAASQQTLTMPEGYSEYTDSSASPYVKTQYWETDTALEQTFSAQNEMLIFNNREYIAASVEPDEKQKYTAQIGTYKTDLTKLNQMSAADITALYGYIPEEYYRGSAVDADVKAEVHTVTYERTKTGTTYDIQSRRAIAEYEFTPVDEIVKTYDIRTKDGKATLNDISVSVAEGYAYVKFIMTDSTGKQSFTKAFVIPERYMSHDTYTLEADKRDVNVGDTVTLSVKTSETARILREGTFIYVVIRDGIYETVYSKEPSAKFKFQKEYVPGVIVNGAYFDGKNIFDLGSNQILYDKAHAKLDISVTPERNTYAPGEEAKLTVKITGPDGTPAAAAFNINVMDSALLSAYDNDFDILSSLYEDDLYQYPVSAFVSHRDFNTKSYGEGGGGGGSDIRSDFEDTPAFICGTTNSDGTAKVSVPLSDSLTSWCVIAQGVTADAKAGSAEATVVTTKDLFVTANRTTKFKPEDDVVVAFRFDGAKASGDVTTSVSIEKDKKNIAAQTLTHPVRKTEYLNFGKLAEGDYTIRISGTAGTAKDAVEYPVTIEKSHLTLTAVTNDLQNVNGISALFLYDENQKAYAERLERLLMNGAARLDQVLGREIAASLSENPVKDAVKCIDPSLLDPYNKLGYASYQMDSDGDDLVSVIIASLLGDNADTGALAYYFDEKLKDPKATREDILIALWGKAALHQPVNADLAHYYADGNGLSSEQQLYFALAYAYGGDQTKANMIYTDHIKPLLQKTDLGGLYLKDEDPFNEQRNNVLLAMLASRISSADTAKIMKYHDAQNGDSVYTYYADIANVLYYVPLLEGKNKAEIFTNGQKIKTVEYEKFAPCRVILTESAKTVEVKSEEGVTFAQIKRAVNADTLLKKQNSSGEIAVSYDGENAGAVDLSVGDTVTVTLTFPSGPQDGCVDMILPAGLHFESSDDEYSYVELQPDRSHLKIYGGSETQSSVRILLRAVLPGEFTAEPAIQISESGESYRLSDAKTIRINVAA